jgi:hypothetical protein
MVKRKGVTDPIERVAYLAANASKLEGQELELAENELGQRLEDIEVQVLREPKDKNLKKLESVTRVAYLKVRAARKRAKTSIESHSDTERATQH